MHTRLHTQLKGCLRHSSPQPHRWVTPSNPQGKWQPAISRSTVLLHYAYTSAADVVARAAQSSCPKEYVAAALKGDISKVRVA